MITKQALGNTLWGMADILRDKVEDDKAYEWHTQGPDIREALLQRSSQNSAHTSVQPLSKSVLRDPDRYVLGCVAGLRE